MVGVGSCTLSTRAFPILVYLRTRDTGRFYAPDTESYVKPAQELINHHRFYSEGTPEIVRTPGYPLLLTPGLALNRLWVVTLVVQIVLSSLTIYLVYRTAKTLFNSERASLIAATLYSVEPLSIIYTSLLLSETLFTAITMV